MEHVTIVGTEDNLLVLATESGERFALPIDDVLRAEIRRGQRPATAAPLAASPREIQTQIRSGLSATETSELLGVDLAVVQRFEGPVLAEREHIVSQALALPVLIGNEVEPDAQPTFGEAVRLKLADLHAEGERWASWKEESGWIVKLEFTANEVDHDARWSFDPRRSVLTPLNTEATQLSRQGTLPDGLIPRLRALENDRVSPFKDDTRFDSGAFGPRRPSATEFPGEVRPELPERSAPAVQDAATKRAPAPSNTSAETADLLEALRRRRGQRESLPDAETVDEPKTPISMFDTVDLNEVPRRGLTDLNTWAPAAPPVSEPPAVDEPVKDSESDAPGKRRKRSEMPSWDEIVFGARSDD